VSKQSRTTTPSQKADHLRLFTAYRKSLLASGKSGGTIDQRLGDVRRFAMMHPDLLEAARADLVDYFALGSHWAPEYRKKVRASMRSFYEWAQCEGYIETNPALVLKPVSIRRSKPRVAPEDVVKRAFAESNLPLRAIIALAAVMGLRRSEIAALHPRDRDGQQIRVRGKGDYIRLLTLDPVTHQLLLKLEVEQGSACFYFPGRFGDHLHPCTVYKWIKDAIGHDWTPHSLRRRAATIGFAGTKDLRAVQEFLGHASVATTQLYVATSQDEIAAVAASAAVCLQEESLSATSRRMAGTSNPDGGRGDRTTTQQLLIDVVNLSARAQQLGLRITVV